MSSEATPFCVPSRSEAHSSAKSEARPTLTCPLCHAVAHLAYAGHAGFRAPARYDVYACAQCETSFAEPLRTDPAIYELIYAKSSELPGYERYARYRALLQSSSDPLGDLCNQEDVYWAVREALRALPPGHGRPVRILELGSGFGYLTYALRQAGYDCTGVDISRSAVESAVKDFGDHYRVADLAEMVAPSGGGAQVVIATELIEHLPDPMAFLASAASLLAPGGVIILTTPNRDIYPARHAWSTDPPPVHLWWFSPTSLRYLAWTLGMSARFVDFTGFYMGRPPTLTRKATKPQTFDADGNVIFRDSAIKTVARRAMRAAPWLFRPLGGLFLTSLSFSRAREALFQDSLSLCVTLTPRVPRPVTA